MHNPGSNWLVKLDLTDGETSKENSCRDIVDSHISNEIYYLILSQRNLAFKLWNFINEV